MSGFSWQVKRKRKERKETKFQILEKRIIQAIDEDNLYRNRETSSETSINITPSLSSLVYVDADDKVDVGNGVDEVEVLLVPLSNCEVLEGRAEDSSKLIAL